MVPSCKVRAGGLDAVVFRTVFPGTGGAAHLFLTLDMKGNSPKLLAGCDPCLELPERPGLD